LDFDEIRMSRYKGADHPDRNFHGIHVLFERGVPKTKKKRGGTARGLEDA
jgi:hypothetical protein